MIAHYRHLKIELADSPFERVPCTIYMQVNFAKEQLPHLKKELFTKWVEFAKKDLTQSCQNVEEVNIISKINLEDPSKGETFGCFRVTIRCSWPYPAIVSSVLRFKKRIENHAILSGYNFNGTKRRVLSGKNRTDTKSVQLHEELAGHFEP